MGMRKRVVVTGIGTVNPLGNNLEATWDKASRGISGITRITKFDATGFPTQIAGEVKDFDPLAYIEKKRAQKDGYFYPVRPCCL